MKPKTKRIGRPPKNENKQRDDIRVRISSEAKENLAEMANAQHRTIIQQASMMLECAIHNKDE